MAVDTLNHVDFYQCSLKNEIQKLSQYAVQDPTRVSDLIDKKIDTLLEIEDIKTVLLTLS